MPGWLDKISQNPGAIIFVDGTNLRNFAGAKYVDKFCDRDMPDMYLQIHNGLLIYY